MLVERGGCVVLICCVAAFYKGTKACHKDIATSVCARSRGLHRKVQQSEKVCD